MVGLRRDPPHRYDFGSQVDAIAVDALRSHLRGITVAPRRLELACDRVLVIDPVGAALLWLLCTELERSVGTRTSLLHLPLALSQKLRSHPLQHYIAYGDDLFQDPFHSPLPSNR
jgi:hypothetical protein